MFLKAECRKMDSGSKDTCFREYAHTANTINLHLHIRITVGISKIRKMGTPSGILCISLNDDRVFIQGVRQG
jgi:hypothetical protein